MSWNATQRAKLLEEIRKINIRRKGPEKARYTIEQRREMYLREKQLQQEYAENMPYHEFSKCPFCGTVAEMPMDTEGLDGIWWWKVCPVEIAKPHACEHFQVYQGALDLHGRNPHEIMDAVGPGPGVPFVISRLLEIDTVRAVLSSFQLETGDTAYMVTYFSEEPLDQAEKHQPWGREFYSLVDEDGVHVASETKLDAWDFEIGKWVESGKLMWTIAGDPSFELHAELPSPYDNLEGIRESQIITQEGVFLKPAPSGGASALHERL